MGDLLERKSIIVVAVAAGINYLIVSGPLLVVYLLSLGAEVENIGTVMSVMILSGTIASFFGGALSDVYGKRNIIILALCCDFAGSMGLMMSSTWTHALAAVVIRGTAVGLFNPVLQGLVATLASPERLGQAFGTVGTIRGGCLMIGPAVGGVLAHRYGYTVMWLGIALSTLVSLICFLFIHEEAPQERTAAIHPGKILKESYSRIRTVFQHSVARLFLITSFGGTFAFSLVESYISVHAKNIGANEAQIGLLGSVFGATFFLNYIGGRFSDSIPSIYRKILLVSVLIVLRFTTLVSIPFINSFYILAGVWFLVYAYGTFGSAPSSAVASHLVDRSVIATFFGASFTVGTLGMSFAPQIGGLIWSLSSEVVLYGTAMILGLIALIPYAVFIPRLLSKEVCHVES